MTSFEKPNFDAPVDLEGVLAQLPPDATGKGLFFLEIINRVRKEAPTSDLGSVAALAGKTFQPFLDYPQADYLRLLVAGARALHPDLALGEGLRRLGQRAYEALLPSVAGRLIFGVLGVDFEQVLAHGPEGFALSQNFGTLEVEVVGPRHVLYHFRDMPSLHATYGVGIVEGAMAHYGLAGEVLVAQRDHASATFEIRWT